MAAVCVGAWKDEDWGEQASKFVDNTVPALSRAIADAELRKRWEANMSTFHLELLVLIEAIDQQLTALTIAELPPTTSTLPELQQYVLTLHSQLKLLTQLEYELENGNSLIAASVKACDSPTVYAALDYGTILRTGIFAVTLPTPDFKLEVSAPNPIVAFVSMLSAGLVADKVSKQNDIFEQALERAPSRLISETQTFELSRTICNERRAKYAGFVDTFQTALSQQLGLIHKMRDLINSLRPEAETRLLSGIAARRLASEGLDDLIPEIDAAALVAEISLQSTIIREHVLKEFGQRDSSNCVAWWAQTETLSSYIAEALLQADALAGTPDADVRTTVASLQTFLQDASSRLKSERAGALPRICK